MVKLFNFWYFFFILFATGMIVFLYFLLKNRSMKTKKIVLFSILFFNLVLHFLKLTFPPYSTNAEHAMKNVWFINVCATSVLFFPFIFISKSNTAKDYMFYLGVISGFLALLYPTEALDKSVLTLDLWRFYFCHIILILVPILMSLLGIHKPNFKRIWKMPFCIMAMLLFIICNQVLQSELGIIPLRNDDFFNVNFSNPSLIWGPTDAVAVLFSWLTPNFMKVIPFGAYAGQTKYWPFFWMIPGVFVYFLVLPFILCLIFNKQQTINDLVLLVNSIKSKFKSKKL